MGPDDEFEIEQPVRTKARICKLESPLKTDVTAPAVAPQVSNNSILVVMYVVSLFFFLAIHLCGRAGLVGFKTLVTYPILVLFFSYAAEILIAYFFQFALRSNADNWWNGSDEIDFLSRSYFQDTLTQPSLKTIALVGGYSILLTIIALIESADHQVRTELWVLITWRAIAEIVCPFRPVDKHTKKRFRRLPRPDLYPHEMATLKAPLREWLKVLAPYAPWAQYGYAGPWLALTADPAPEGTTPPAPEAYGPSAQQRSAFAKLGRQPVLPYACLYLGILLLALSISLFASHLPWAALAVRGLTAIVAAWCIAALVLWHLPRRQRLVQTLRAWGNAYQPGPRFEKIQSLRALGVTLLIEGILGTGIGLLAAEGGDKGIAVTMLAVAAASCCAFFELAPLHQPAAYPSGVEITALSLPISYTLLPEPLRQEWLSAVDGALLPHSLLRKPEPAAEPALTLPQTA